MSMIILNIKRACPYTATVTLTYKASGEPVILTDCTILFTAKNLDDYTLTDDAAVIKSKLTISEEANGLAILSLTAEDTAVTRKLYKCDIRVYKEDELQHNTDIFCAEVRDIITTRIA